MPKLLEVDDLRVEFTTDAGTVVAVDGVSYQIDEGQTVAIVGESGCGKSVAAMSILGLVPDPPGHVAGGAIRFRGRNLLELGVQALRAVRGREIAMIFQEPMTSLNPVLSIGLQLTEAMQVHLGLDRAQARAGAVELLATVGIPEPERRLRQYPHHLSGGMRQRVMIAIALSCRPRLVIADEPTTALDVTIQAQILELLKDLTRRFDVALEIITHNLGVVARYADRVNVMYAGRIVEMGSAEQIYRRPRHPYTVGLLASVPRMDRPRGTRLTPIDGQPPDLAHLDPGCAYRARCSFAQARCADARPKLETVGDQHLAACFFHTALDLDAGSAP